MVSETRHAQHGKQQGTQLDDIVGPFADMLLAADLPQLGADRRAEVVRFVQRRSASVPSFTRFGVIAIGVLFRVVLALPGGPRLARALASCPVPLLSEYPRLIRSLAYAYIWDHWPDTTPTGAQL